MGDARIWSDSDLRAYLRRIDSGDWWSDSDDARERAAASFRAAARLRSAPVAQRAAREVIGALLEPEGVAMVAESLVTDHARDDERRWLLVTPRPWAYLGEWTGAEIIRTFRKARATGWSSPKQAAAFEREFGPRD